MTLSVYRDWMGHGLDQVAIQRLQVNCLPTRRFLSHSDQGCDCETTEPLAKSCVRMYETDKLLK